MKILISRLSHIATTATLTLWCCLAQSDDTEVYVGADSGIDPIAIMAIDTSGSMSYWVEEEGPDYDANIIYNEQFPKDPDGYEINYPFKSNLYYFSSYDVSNVSLNYSYINYLTGRSFPITALACQSAGDSMSTNGQFTDRFKRWNTSYNRWYPRSNNSYPYGSDSNTQALIECKSDENKYPPGLYIDNKFYNSKQYTNKTQNGTWNYYIPYIYHNNYLNYLYYKQRYEDSFTAQQKSRMQITKEAAKYVVDTTGGIKLGLSRFETDDYNPNGGMIDIAVDDIENIRDKFSDKIDSYLPWGGTPLTELFHETALYLRGDDVLYGKNSYIRSQKPNTTLSRESNGFISYSYSNKNKTNYIKYPSVSDSTSTSGSKYISPITSACQTTSNIVLFTDGAPSVDDESNYEIRSLIKSYNIDFDSDKSLTADERSVLSENCSGSGGCIEELAYLLANYDQRPDLPGMQTINTHVIGGFFDEDSSESDLKRMEAIASLGKGTYSIASNKDDIVKAFRTAVTSVFDDPVTFVAPAVSVNSYNSLEHLDNLYYAMFVPSAENSWKGNLKSYRLSPDGIVVDANGDEAIDSTSGLFKSTSRSYWTAEGTTDGNSVTKGGAASNLIKENNIFTHLSKSKGALSTTLTTSSISKELLGLPDDASSTEHQEIIDWLNRKTVDGSRQQMEDPLHSRPIVVNYGYTQDSTTNEIEYDGVVFVGSNSGYLHAFKADANNFEEYFSFIPQELLKNASLYLSSDKDQPKTYGVDGPINYWHVDANQNLQVDNGEKVYLFFGLRRGGDSYYALDITDKEKPKFQWQISGGEGDFKKLGQTWSPMTLAKVKWGNAGKTKVVLLFGGGYDSKEDDRDNREVSDVGNAIYMIDPETGELLWSASNNSAATNLTSMTSSITSEIKAIDFDGDQVTDYLFVSDLGGRIWRFDLNTNQEEITKSNFVAGAGMIFDANKNSSNYQRFYDAPSVSYFKDNKTAESFLTISIGSGFRAHPLDGSSKDSFYIIKDTNIISAPKDYKYETLTPADFTDIPEGTQLTSPITTKGWKYDLKTGEKVLATPLTANGNMYFTTFSPNISTPNPNTCNADIGYSLAYAVDFMGDDDPSLDPVSPSISSTVMPNIGIPPQVIELNTTDTGQKLFCELNPEHESCQPKKCEETGTCPDPCESTGTVILSGTHVIDSGTLRCDLLKKNYWRSL